MFIALPIITKIKYTKKQIVTLTMIYAMLFVMLTQSCFAKQIAIKTLAKGFIIQFLISNFSVVTFKSFIKFNEQVKMFEKTITPKNPSIPKRVTKIKTKAILSDESIVL